MTTPYMNLSLPIVSVTIGPDWAAALNVALNLVDGHDHTLNNGTILQLSNIEIDDDVDFQSFAITNLDSLQINNLAVAPTALGNLYMLGGELYFKNSTAAIKITSGAGVNVSASGNITGMDADSSVTYYDSGLPSTHDGKYIFIAEAAEYADLEIANLRIFEHDAGISNYVELKSPSALASSFSLVLPSALPASTSLLSLSSAGQIGTTTSPILSGLTVNGDGQFTGNLIVDTLKIVDGAALSLIPVSDAAGNAVWGQAVEDSIADDAITTNKLLNLCVKEAKIDNLAVSSGKLASNSVTTSKILDGNVTMAKLAAHINGSSSLISDYVSDLTTSEFQVETTHGSGTYIQATITCTGRPVIICLVSGTAADARAQASTTDMQIIFKRDTTTLTRFYVNGGAEYPSGCYFYIDVPAAGSHTYKLYGDSIGSAGQLRIRDMYLKVYEL